MVPPMRQQLKNALAGSTVVSLGQKIGTAMGNSRMNAILNDPRVIVGLLVTVLLISLVRIFLADIHTSVKFLSFLLLTVVLLVLVWPFTKPLADS